MPSAVRGTMSVVAPNAQHLSPAVGLALSAGGAQLIANLYELEPRVPMATGTRGFSADGVPVTFQGSPSGALCRDIFHRNHPEEPLRPTSNRSLPAAHLSASLVADTLGLAWRRPGKSEVRVVEKKKLRTRAVFGSGSIFALRSPFQRTRAHAKSCPSQIVPQNVIPRAPRWRRRGFRMVSANDCANLTFG